MSQDGWLSRSEAFKNSVTNDTCGRQLLKTSTNVLADNKYRQIPTCTVIINHEAEMACRN